MDKKKIDASCEFNINDDPLNAALQLHKMRVSFERAGFSEEEAFRLVQTILAEAIRHAGMSMP